MSAILSFFGFSVLTLIAYLKAFLDIDWADLGVSRKVGMSSFQNTKDIEILMVQSKVMALESELTRPALFSRYLNHFNSDFDLWAVVGKGIWYF